MIKPDEEVMICGGASVYKLFFFKTSLVVFTDPNKT